MYTSILQITNYKNLNLLSFIRFVGVDQAIQNVKDKMEILCTTSSDQDTASATANTSLETVLSNMKDTLSSIRSQVNHKTLLELNRELTPFDLPALSPLPQVQLLF